MGGCQTAAGEDRFLDLAGAGNIRDLGGLPAAAGRRTRRGRILRGDLLVRLREPDERALLGGFGLRTVVDLRTEREWSRFPGPWEGHPVAVVRAALPVDPAFVANSTEEMLGLYLSFLEPPATAAGQAIAALLDPGQQPLLIHCAAGKDRTGVLVALALELAGVDRAAIVADYALTQTRIRAVLKRLEAEAGRTHVRVLPEVMYGAAPATMEGFLAGLDRRYGGAAAWAGQRGIGAERVERFREALLEPAEAAGPSR